MRAIYQIFVAIYGVTSVVAGDQGTQQIVLPDLSRASGGRNSYGSSQEPSKPVTGEEHCKEVSFTVFANATNKNITGIPLDQGVDAIIEFYNKAPGIKVSGNQNIQATFCDPLEKNANNSKLQLLFSSVTTTRGAWNGLGGLGTDYEPYKPELYSWVRYANKLGYPTLALDRLGSGKSSHPEPFNMAQGPYEMAIYNALAKKIRAGDPQLPQKYGHLIWIGNSHGAQLGGGTSGIYPDAFDEYILTGFTNSPQKGLKGFAMSVAAPASLVDYLRFHDLNPAYLTTASMRGRTNSFFGSSSQVEYEETMVQLFYDRQDVVSAGQFASIYALPFVGGNFTGRIFNLIGEQDQSFCGFGSPVFGPATCGKQPEETGADFPHADYNWQSIDKMGHVVQLHSRSQTLFELAHRFLAGESFHSKKPV